MLKTINQNLVEMYIKHVCLENVKVFSLKEEIWGSMHAQTKCFFLLRKNVCLTLIFITFAITRERERERGRMS